MGNNDNIIMSRIAFERMQAKEEKENRFKNIIIILLIVFLVVTNAFWLIYESQYETVADEVSVEAGDSGNAFYIGNDGDITNGTNNTQDSHEAQG